MLSFELIKMITQVIIKYVNDPHENIFNNPMKKIKEIHDEIFNLYI